MGKLSGDAKEYAESIGLSGNVEIVVNKSKWPSGGVGFSKPIDGKQVFNPKIEIYNNGTLTAKQFDEIVRHEMTHLKQGQTDRFFLQKIDGSWNIIWEGKPYMKMSEYNRIVNGFSGNASAAYIKKMYEKYRSLPWEAEAHLAGDPFK
jgi:hypothetical protein